MTSLLDKFIHSIGAVAALAAMTVKPGSPKPALNAPVGARAERPPTSRLLKLDRYFENAGGEYRCH